MMKRKNLQRCTAMIAVVLLVLSLFAYTTAHAGGHKGETQKQVKSHSDSDHGKKLRGSIKPVHEKNHDRHKNPKKTHDHTDKSSSVEGKDNHGKHQHNEHQHETTSKKHKHNKDHDHNAKDSKKQSGRTEKGAENEQEPAVKAVFRGCSEVWFVLSDSVELPSTIDINGESKIVSSDQFTKIPGHFGDRSVYKFNVHEYAGKDAKIGSVTINGKVYENDHRCADNKADEEDSKKKTDSSKDGKKKGQEKGDNKKGDDKKSGDKKSDDKESGKKKSGDKTGEKKDKDRCHVHEHEHGKKMKEHFHCDDDNGNHHDETKKKPGNDKKAPEDGKKGHDDDSKDSNKGKENPGKKHGHDKDKDNDKKEKKDGNDKDHDDSKKQKPGKDKSKDKKDDSDDKEKGKDEDKGKDNDKGKKKHDDHDDEDEEHDDEKEGKKNKDKKSKKSGYPCSEYCDVSIDEIVNTIKQLKDYVDWKVDKHEDEYNHKQLHSHEGKKSVEEHEHSEYITAEDAANSFAPKNHGHEHTHDGYKKGKKGYEHSHNEYAPKGHTHDFELPEHTHEETGKKTSNSGDHDHSALISQMKQYVDETAGDTKTVVKRVGPSESKIKERLMHWAASRFATKQDVQKLEQQNKQLRKELDYLKKATGHEKLDTGTAADVMADGEYEKFAYGDTSCYVYQNTYGNTTAPKKVQCVK